MSMALEETIEQVERMHKESRSGWLYALKRGETIYAERCKKSMDEFGQLAEWLKELAERRKLPEIIYCGECELKIECCRNIRSGGRKDDDFCSCGRRAERRTDETD